MKRKVMLLMLMIPVLFLITVFSVGKVVSLVVDIPVSGIVITTQTENGILSLDMATYENDIRILAEVQPSNAKIKDYSISVSEVGNDETAEVVVGEDGLLTVLGTGRAKITVTSNENSYTDSIILDVVSSKVVDFVPSLTDNSNQPIPLVESEGDCDYTATISSGVYDFSNVNYPNTLSESAVKWYSSDENVLSINEVLGRARAFLSGEVIVTAVNEMGVHGNIEKRIKLNISKADTPSGITVNGGEGANVSCQNGKRTVSLFVEIPNGFTKEDVIVSGENLLLCNLVSLSGEERLRADITLLEATDSTISIKVNEKLNTVGLVFSEYAFNVFTPYHRVGDNTIYQKQGSEVSYVASCDTYDEAVTYEWQSSDSDVLAIDSKGITALLNAKKEGTATLSVTAKKAGKTLGNTVIKQVTVVKPVSSLNFATNTQTHGIADLLAVGEYSISGNDYRKDYMEHVLLMNVKGKTEEYAGKDIDFISSDTSIATPHRTLTDFSIDIIATGKVTFVANWIYADYFGEKVSTAITLQAVKEGVNVFTYEDVRKATADGKIVVLHNDIMMGKKDATSEELKALAYKTATTYDWQYYANKGNTDPPEILYLMEFKNDVYGNGYELNADYFTRATDQFGAPLLFKGPLNFVAMEPYAAVKGQDNIVFLARTEGVTINNIELKGCLDESLLDENGFNLSLLNYTGTTLEIAENVTLKNSRVSNGRTVVRIYGGKSAGGPVIADSSMINIGDERVVAKIESCILTTAREFILKLGSNRALLNTMDGREVKYQTFKKPNGANYDVYDDSIKTDEYFYNKYVATDVTLKNSVLARSGLFSIGIETHFSGPMLLGGSSFVLQYWEKLAATSYASVLRMEGDVKIFDWKELSIVDSSTLIETSQTEGNESFDFLSLDVAAMLKSVSTNRPEYRSIITRKGGKEYVHSGIAMYGGGLNYSYIDFSKMTTESFVDYRVNLSILKEGINDESNSLYRQGNLLPLAAGKGDFRFYMYNSKSESNYEKQVVLGGSYSVPACQ